MDRMALYTHTAQPHQLAKQWSPYENNGGTVLAVSGADFVIVAGDTRVSTGYSINTRNGSKLTQLTDNCVIATSGMLADQITLHKTLKARMVFYEQQHRKEMSTTSIAQMLSNTLYYKRFFPYYTFNIIAGLDAEGKGAVYGYDAVGSFQRVPVVCQGTGHELIQPVVDNQIDRKHQAGKDRWDIPEADAVTLVKDCFTAASERDIYTGDFVDIMIINKDGIREERYELKHD